MLVLSRRMGETVVIRLNRSLAKGEEILIRVSKGSGRSVRLGFQAPPEVDIVREEVDLHRQAERPDANRRKVRWTCAHRKFA